MTKSAKPTSSQGSKKTGSSKAKGSPSKSSKSNKKEKSLVIVESPTKAKTLNKYLDGHYKVLASMGHIIDLPKSRMAIDTENDFQPHYITVRGRAKVLNQLKREAAKAKAVYIASDPDREGEAISYHLYHSLYKYNSEVNRVVFNEITKEAVNEAMAHPRAIDMNLFYAQQARRILDRLVGYEISPILWKKLKKGLSAGRVQSVAMRLICDREREIENFDPKEYWHIDAHLKSKKGKFQAQLFARGGEEQKIEIKNEQQANDLMEQSRSHDFVVSRIKESTKKRNPLPPYTTSKLQQDAATRLGFASGKTMMVAQQLYEGVDLPDEGPTGLITYMRTDSVRISDHAMNNVRRYIENNFEADYLPDKPNYFKVKKGAQDAHEAIRPTDAFRSPQSIKASLTRDQFKLYELIWSKFIASQMTPEVADHKTVIIQNGELFFKATGKNVIFWGFTKILPEIVAQEDGKEKKSKGKSLPALEEGQVVDLEKLEPSQHFTSPPPRFTDATLVKTLEESGVGRPSTYAPTVLTLIKRYYVKREGRQLYPTELGLLVNNLLIENFPDLLQLEFTAKMEQDLDKIEEGDANWVQMLRTFYDPFKKTVNAAQSNIAELKSVLDEPTDHVCEKCGRNMVKKLGRYGYFLACPGFPECRNAKPIPLGPCPLPSCDGQIIKRSTKRNREFYGCSRYPECTFTTWDAPIEKSQCSSCGSTLFERKKRKENFEVCLNPECPQFADKDKEPKGQGQ